MKEFNYTITDPQGVHARPAGILVKEAAKYESNISCVSNMYNCNNSGSGTSYTTGMWFQSVQDYKRLYIANSNYATVDAFKNNIKTLYETNNPLIVDYILNSPIENSIYLEPITTIKGTNIITIPTTINSSNIEISS